MQRRTVLASALGGTVSVLGGCARLRSVGGPATDERIVRVAQVDDPPPDADLALAVDLRQAVVDATQTARIRVTTTNHGDTRVVSVGDGPWCSLFNREQGGSIDPPGLWLHHPGHAGDISRDGDRWVADRSPDEPRAFPDIGCVPGRLPAGESVSNEYVVWDDYQEPGYLLPDTYRWEADVTSRPDDAGDDEGAAATSLRWGFSLEVDVS